MPVSRALIPAALAALTLTAAPAFGAPTPVPTGGVAEGTITRIVPGITYQVLTRPGPQRLHIISYTHNVLTRIAPGQAAGLLTERATLSDGMASRLAQGATAAINGDFFSIANGTPSGVLSVGPELLASPEPTRSSLAIGAGGALSVGPLALSARYRQVDGETGTTGTSRILRAINRPLPATSTTGVVAYTPAYGSHTPSGSGYEVVVALDVATPFPVAGSVRGTVIAHYPGGGTPIAEGQVVVSGRNLSGITLVTEHPPGTRMEIETSLPGVAPDAWGAIGGGPMLVSGGTPVTSTSESFTSSQMKSRTARSAIGQTGDGTILMVAAEGPGQGVRGYSMPEQATMMASLGAVTAMGLDAGGSSLMAIGGRQVVPWRSERAVSDMLVAYYMGAQLSIPADNRITANGDGVADTLTLGAQSPVAGTTTVTVTRRTGGFHAVLLDRTGPPEFTPVTIDPTALGMPDGPYAVTATLTPTDGSAPTAQARIIVVDRTLGSMTVASPGTGVTRRATASFTLSRPASVTARVTDRTGRVVATLATGTRMRPGRRTLTWTVRTGSPPAPPGTYEVTIVASSSLGRAGLRDDLRVR